MVALGELAREGFELIQQTIVGQLSDLLRARASIRSVQTKSLRLKASGEPQDVLRIHGKLFIILSVLFNGDLFQLRASEMCRQRSSSRKRF
jgi:hypothetical protein